MKVTTKKRSLGDKETSKTRSSKNDGQFLGPHWLNLTARHIAHMEQLVEISHIVNFTGVL